MSRQDKHKTKAQLIEELDALRRKMAHLERDEEMYRFSMVGRLISDYAYAFRVDTDGQLMCIWVGGSIEKVTGFTFEEIQRRGGWETLIFENDMPIPVGQLKALLAGNPKTVEYRILDKENRVRWMRDCARPVYDNREERVTLIYGAVQDITGEKKAETALKKSEKNYRMMVESSNDLIFQEDIEGNFVFFNKAFETMLGYTPEDMTQMNGFEIIHPDDIPAAQEIFSRMITGKHVKGHEVRTRKKNGDYVYIMVDAIPVYDSHDNIIGIAGTGKDITVYKKAEAALRESEAKYRHLIQHSHDAIYVLYDRKFEMINDKFTEMLGVTLEEANHPNFDFMDLVAPGSRKLIKERNRQIMKGDSMPAQQYEFTAIAGDGSEIELEVSVSYIKYKKGIATQGILRDITHRKQLEAQLRQSQKMEAIGRLAGGVAHDFNNILTVINGYGSLILSRMDQGEKYYKYITQMKDAGERASRLTNQLLAFSRKQVIRPRVVNLNTMVTEMETMLRRLVRENIDFVMKLESDTGNVNVDPGQMEQVIMNLVVNARDAMPTGGVLSIHTSRLLVEKDFERGSLVVKPGPYCLLEVADTGIGMDEEIYSHVFEPFFSTKAKGKGTGLGLATVYGIVKQNNGYIWLDTQPGKGTKVEIYLPQVKKSPRQKTEEIKAFSTKGNETVLLVEDDDAVRNLAREILVENGYTVLEAVQGEDALDISRRHEGKIDLLLTDVVMPEISGRQLAEQLVMERPDIEVIYLSGYSYNAIAHHGVLEPGVTFIQKPFSPAILLQKIRSLLDK